VPLCYLTCQLLLIPLTVDHTIMLDVLSRRFGLRDEALNWLEDFLTDRSPAIHNGVTESDDVALRFGVPQGSVIGPKSLIEYAEDVEGVFEKYQLHHHLFADDMQGHYIYKYIYMFKLHTYLNTLLNHESLFVIENCFNLNNFQSMAVINLTVLTVS